MADPIPITCVPLKLTAPRYPAITQIIHIVKPQKMQGSTLLTSADPMHEIAVTNRIAVRLHNCISFTTATIFYGQQVSDSVIDAFTTTELSLRRAVLGAFLRMNSEARAIKARHHDVKHLFRYIFIWYSPNGGPVLPDTFRASAVPTWPQIDDILKKTAIHLDVIAPTSDNGALRFFSGLSYREISPRVVQKATPVLYPNFRVFEHVRESQTGSPGNTNETEEAMSVDSPQPSSASDGEISFLDPLQLPSNESLPIPFPESFGS